MSFCHEINLIVLRSKLKDNWTFSVRLCFGYLETSRTLKETVDVSTRALNSRFTFDLSDTDNFTLPVSTSPRKHNGGHDSPSDAKADNKENSKDKEKPKDVTKSPKESDPEKEKKERRAVLTTSTPSTPTPKVNLPPGVRATIDIAGPSKLSVPNSNPEDKPRSSSDTPPPGKDLPKPKDKGAKPTLAKIPSEREKDQEPPKPIHKSAGASKTKDGISNDVASFIDEMMDAEPAPPERSRSDKSRKDDAKGARSSKTKDELPQNPPKSPKASKDTVKESIKVATEEQEGSTKSFDPVSNEIDSFIDELMTEAPEDLDKILGTPKEKEIKSVVVPELKLAPSIVSHDNYEVKDYVIHSPTAESRPKPKGEAAKPKPATVQEASTRLTDKGVLLTDYVIRRSLDSDTNSTAKPSLVIKSYEGSLSLLFVIMPIFRG